MTINPSQFGFTVDNYNIWPRVHIPMPAIEMCAKWSDAEPAQGSYHRHRARPRNQINAGDTLYINYRMVESGSGSWNEQHDGAMSGWPWTWANSNESCHADTECTNPINNPTPPDASHRYCVAQIKFTEDSGNVGSPVIDAFEIGWPYDSAISASDPELEFADRTGAHQFDSYNSASAFHIKSCILGTLNRLMRESEYRISFAMADQR